MAVSQVSPSTTSFEAQVRRRVPVRLLLWVSILLGFALLLAENHIQSGFGDDDLGAQVEGQIAQNQGNSTRQICYIVLFGAGLLCVRRVKQVKVVWRTPLAPACAALLSWCALSILWSDDPGTSAKRFVGLFFVIAGAAGLTLVWSRRQIAQFLSVLGFAGISMGFLDELVYRAFQPWAAGYRFAGTQHENVQGFCCLLMVMASLAAADMTPRFRLLFRLLAGYGGIFLILTKSRSSILAVVLALVIYVLLTRPSRNIGGLLGGVSVVTLMLYMSDVLNPVLNYVSRDGEGLDTLTGRKPLWALADEFIQRQPFIGYGFQVFWSAQHIDYFSGAFGWQISSAHNGFLETLLTLGYVGMILHGAVLFLGVVMGALYYKRTGIALYACASAMFAALLCVGMFESAVLISTGPYSFGLIILMASLCFEPVFEGTAGELPPVRRELVPRPTLLPKNLVKV